jgi:sugar phosphate isomerase/epimerase
MTNRRTFLAQAGLVSAACFIKPNLLSAAAPKRIAGLQLYSLREQLPKDVKGVIPKIAEAGYKQVETFGYNKQTGYWGLSAKDFSQLLKDNGLSSPSGHYDINQYLGTGSTEDLQINIDVCHALGQEYLVVPSLREQFIKTGEDFKNIADKMNKTAEFLKKEGLKLGYHNHNFEWKPADGTTFYDTLLANTDPALVHMEMDIFWVVRAGQDPIAILEKHKGRYKFVHIKDRDKTRPNLNTEVGKGSIDFVSIIPKAKEAGVQYFIMEQENYIDIDPYISIKESADYIKNVLKA